ncbi:FAD-dependent oxidoreductase [Nodosilinea sp. E11]|uniref:FAD-dependent oxidoreductase n=1 Tax=Nodosilinea sp. E11 TaxID=3037479 RepID=UPI0029342613|nr:FAD-dependent oxidoreductase [Nodosilinea sp. E11]WOD40420.1 FAD-dependent oxidoreductase [Nodosilinea sp. E11]
MYDAIVIGGGFYGTVIANYLMTKSDFSKVLLIEQQSTILSRASYNNQARIHNGYHYPRSFTTACRSQINLPQFLHDYPKAAIRNFTKLYAIARRNSNVTAKQFVRFCRDIGAYVEPAPQNLRLLFEPRLIEQVFLVEEYAFDASVLKEHLEKTLKNLGVELKLETRVSQIRIGNPGLTVECAQSGQSPEILSARYVFNCTYSGLNQIGGDFVGTQTRLKHEIAEIALVKPPSGLANLGITVMDGSFFSLMPFPHRKLHSLTHVRYTPHLHWLDKPGIDPYQQLNEYKQTTRVDRIIRDVSRYLPAIRDVDYVDSLFEIKTVLIKNEGDDGRPILFEQHKDLPGCYSILGGKLDNIYDCLIRLETEISKDADK